MLRLKQRVCIYINIFIENKIISQNINNILNIYIYMDRLNIHKTS